MTDKGSRTDAEDEYLRAKGALKAGDNHLEKISNEFLGDILHDISNPAGYVKSNISSLKKYIFSIQSAFIEYETQLLKTGLDQSVINSLKAKYDLEYILGDINELVDDSIEGLNRIETTIKHLKAD